MKLIRALLQESAMHTMLGRWCHVTAPLYRSTCIWEKKVDMANMDNTGSFAENSKSEEKTHCPRAPKCQELSNTKI